MIRKTGLIRTMAEAQALYASEIKRVKNLVNRYLPDPRVFDISVPSRRLPDGLMVFKPVVYKKDGKTVATEASIEIIPHVDGEYVYEQFMDLDAEFRIDWKLGLLEKFTEEWFYEEFSKELITANALIERIRKNEPPKADYSIHTPDASSTTESAYDALKAIADSLDSNHMGTTALRKFIGASGASALGFGNMHWDPKDIARGFSPTIDFSIPTSPDNTTLDILSNKTQELPESNPPSESETPFFFTDVKQLKVKKNKKKKSEKTKSSKSKRK